MSSSDKSIRVFGSEGNRFGPNPTVPPVGYVNIDDLSTALKDILIDSDLNRAIHLKSDVDKTIESQHHTIGLGSFQISASPGAWLPLTLAGGNTAQAAPRYIPAARVGGDRVELRGGISGTYASGTVVTVASVPPSCIPEGVSRLTSTTVVGSAVFNVQIDTSGNINVEQTSGSSVSSVSLDGLYYYLV